MNKTEKILKDIKDDKRLFIVLSNDSFHPVVCHGLSDVINTILPALDTDIAKKIVLDIVDVFTKKIVNFFETPLSQSPNIEDRYYIKCIDKKDMEVIRTAFFGKSPNTNFIEIENLLK